MREYIDDKPNLNQSFCSNPSLLQKRQKINSIKTNIKSESLKGKPNKEKLSLNKFE